MRMCGFYEQGLDHGINYIEWPAKRRRDYIRFPWLGEMNLYLEYATIDM